MKAIANTTQSLIAHKTLNPSIYRIRQLDQETRIDLPGSVGFNNINYIGLVHRETWHVAPHYHDHFELCYVDEGEGWFAIDDFSYQVKKGDLFLTKPGEIHHGAAAGHTPYRLYYLGFQLDKLSNLELDYYQLGIYRVFTDPDDTIKHLFAEMLTELQLQPQHALVMVQSHFLRMLVSVLRIYARSEHEQQIQPIPLSPAIREVLYHIHSQISYLHTIDTLATQVHMSRSHLTREFKRVMGISLGNYTRSLCLEWARLYLRETTTSVSLIAERLHFSSIHTFSIFFKRHTGLSPQEYRKQNMIM